LKSRTHILERTRCFFAGRPDKLCSGAARFEPADSGAIPLRSAASTAATRSPARSGADPRPLRRQDWTVAIAGDEGHVNIRGSAATDKQ
jgi:hypothetical protein